MSWQKSPDFETKWLGCAHCEHQLGGATCKAYPAAIPLLIYSGDVDHLMSRPGQIGDWVFEPLHASTNKEVRHGR